MAILLLCLGILRLKAYQAALLGMTAAFLIAILVYGMPLCLASASTLYGAAYGLLPIGWIILNVLFQYRLCQEKGQFTVLQSSLTSITQDRRLQLILVAFCLSAFFEGAAGFGTPVAVSASILIGLGFTPLVASSLSLIANTAPVPFAGLGTPLIALQAVTGLDLRSLTIVTARQLAIFDMIIPCWIVTAMSGWRGMLEILPALLVTGGSFAIVKLLTATLHGPWLVNIFSSLVSLAALVIFLLRWKPRHIWRFPGESEPDPAKQQTFTPRQVWSAWMPWLVLSLVVFVWGIPQFKSWLDSFSLLSLHIPALDMQVLRMPPIVTEARPEPAIFDLNLLSASGTAILLSAILSSLLQRSSLLDLGRAYLKTLKQVTQPLLTICATLSIGFITRFSGMDGTLGISFAQTGVLYPFFGTLLGWLGVALTGSDTSSNILFGSLQKITALQLGLSPILMAAANSTGGVMGKMLNAQSIVVAATATGWHGHESDILRRVFWHSVVLVFLAGLVVLLMAYITPFNQLVP
jgi:lactate permease